MSNFTFSVLLWSHVIVSLVMLAAGYVVTRDLLQSRIDRSWMAVFIGTGLATSLSGFAFPFDRLGESHFTGIASLIVLALAIVGLYVLKLSGAWRWIFALSVVAAFYFDALVTVAQAFKKIPVLNALAPTASNEPAFVVAQLVLLAIFIWIGIAVFKQFRPSVAIA